jgi:hypothetical protein
MTQSEYLSLSGAESRAHDEKIKASLSAWPAYIQEWREYACRSKLTGETYYGNSSRAALARMVEAEEVWARHGAPR